MTDIATLGLAVDSRQVSQASRELNNFKGAAGAAEMGAARFGLAVNVTRNFVRGLIGGIAGGFGLTGLGIAATRTITEFADLERQTLVLGQVIRATGGSAGRTTDDILDMADAIAATTLATDTQARAAASTLLTFKSVATDTFDRAMVAAQDLAAVGFGSMESAAIQLGKALEDPINGLTMLRRVGVTVSASQREVIRTLMETGRAAEAQRMVLDIIERQVGGAGRAAAGGLAGAFHKLAEASSNWFEVVGGKVASITGMAAALEAMATGLNKVNKHMADPETQLLTAIGQRQGRVRELQAQPSVRSTFFSRGNEPNRAEITKLQAEINSLQGELNAIAQDKAMGANAAFGASLTSQNQQRIDQINGVIDALKREGEMAGKSAMQQKILEEQRKAGVTATSEEGKAIAALVAGQEALNASRSIGIAARQRIEDQKTEANALDMTFRAANKYRFERELLASAEAAGTPITKGLRDAVAALGEQYADLAEKTAGARVAQDIFFERAQLGRTSVEQNIAQTLRGAGIDAESAQGQFLAGQIRINDALTTTRDVSRDVLGGMARDLRNGVSAAEALGNAFNRLADRLMDMALDQAIAMLFRNLGGLGGGGMSFAGASGPFGGIPSPTAWQFHAGTRFVGTGGVRVPRLHRGADLRDDEVFAKLQRGEQVIPKQGTGAGNQPVLIEVRTTTSPLFVNEVRAISGAVVRQQAGDVALEAVGNAQSRKVEGF